MFRFFFSLLVTIELCMAAGFIQADGDSDKYIVFHYEGEHGTVFLPLRAVFLPDNQGYLAGPILTNNGLKYAIRISNVDNGLFSGSQGLLGYRGGVKFTLSAFFRDLETMKDSEDSALYSFVCEKWRDKVFCFVIFHKRQGVDEDKEYAISSSLELPGMPEDLYLSVYGSRGEKHYHPDAGFALNLLLNISEDVLFSDTNSVEDALFSDTSSVDEYIDEIGGLKKTIVSDNGYERFVFPNTTVFKVNILPKDIKFPQTFGAITLRHKEGNSEKAQVLSYSGIPDYGIIIGPISYRRKLMDKSWRSAERYFFIHVLPKSLDDTEIRLIEQGGNNAERSVWERSILTSAVIIKLSQIVNDALEGSESLYDGSDVGDVRNSIDDGNQLLMRLFSQYVDLNKVELVIINTFLDSVGTQAILQHIAAKNILKFVYFPMTKREKVWVYFSRPDSTISTAKIYSPDNRRAGLVFGGFLLNSSLNGSGYYCLHISSPSYEASSFTATLEKEPSPELMWDRVQKMNITGRSAFSENAVSVTLRRGYDSCQVIIKVPGKKVFPCRMACGYLDSLQDIDLYGDFFSIQAGKGKQHSRTSKKFEIFSPDYGALLNLLAGVKTNDFPLSFTPAMLLIDVAKGGHPNLLYSQSSRNFALIPHYRSWPVRTTLYPFKMIGRGLWSRKAFSVVILSTLVAVAVAYQNDPDRVEQILSSWAGMPNEDSIMSGLTQSFQKLGISPVINDETCKEYQDTMSEAAAGGGGWSCWK